MAVKGKLSAAEQKLADGYIERYTAAMHGVQTGEAYLLAKSHPDWAEDVSAAHKHLRVGINSAMVEHAALLAALSEAGMLDMVSYYRHLAEYAERERDDYERRVRSVYGIDPNTKVTLG